MTDEKNTSMLLFAGLMATVILVCGFLAWRMYDAPVDPDGAGTVATRATEVVVLAGGGDARACETMREVSAVDEGDSAVERCTELARGLAGGVPGLGVRGLHVSEVDVGRSSGTATVTGTLLVPGQSFDLTMTWPLTREDGRWTLSDGPEVDVQ